MGEMNTEEENLVSELRSGLGEIATGCGEVWDRQLEAKRVRFCEWGGQSKDGRKHGDDETPALPFEGASDVRVPVVDAVINEKVALLCNAFRRAKLQTTGVEAGDAKRAANTTVLLDWLRRCVMAGELEAEVELAAQAMFGDDPGLAIVAVDWWQDVALRKRTVSRDELALMYASGAQTPEEADAELADEEMMGDFADLVTNPLRGEEWRFWLGQVFPSVSEKALRRIAKDLSSEGTAEVVFPMVVENRPKVEVLSFFRNVFFPLGTTDLQRARGIHRREWVTEDELRTRVATMGWKKKWVEAVIERGKGCSIVSVGAGGGDAGNLSLSVENGIVNEQANLFEVWWSYEKRLDDLGYPGVWCTVWNGSVGEFIAKSELLDYQHGQYPFVLRTRERLSRQVTDSRGLTNPLATQQYEIKVQRDARSNYTQLATTPPMKKKMIRGAWDLVIGPGAEIPVRQMDDFDYLKPPPFPQTSIEMERTTRGDVDEYSGRMSKDANADRVALITQHEVGNFLALWRDVFGQVLALCQQYYSAIELGRVTGDYSDPAPLTMEDIVGRFDVSIEMDARDLNMEYVGKKLELYGKLIGYDAAGTIDRAALIEWAVSGVDPVLARKVLRPMDEVRQREVQDEKNAVAQLAVGIEAAMPTEGVNAQLRLQVLAQTIQGSQQLTARYQGDEGFRALVDNRVKYLQQQVAQEQNKLVGQLGTAPLQENVAV